MGATVSYQRVKLLNELTIETEWGKPGHGEREYSWKLLSELTIEIGWEKPGHGYSRMLTRKKGKGSSNILITFMLHSQLSGWALNTPN